MKNKYNHQEIEISLQKLFLYFYYSIFGGCDTANFTKNYFPLITIFLVALDVRGMEL